MENKKITMVAMAIISVAAFVAVYLFVVNNHKKGGVENGTGKNSATLVSQNNNEFKLDLRFENNGANGVSAIKYAVLLYKVNDKGEISGESPMDVKTYPDNVILGKNSEKYIKREVLYSAPEYLGGKFALALKYFNEAGGAVDAFVLGHVNLQSKSNDFLEVLPDSCFLQIEGTDNTFTLAQGVDIKMDENLLITCSVKNNSSREVRANLKFQNFYKNYLLGELRGQTDVTFGAVSFSGGETKNISLPITKALKPQAYDAALYLADASGKQISNKVYAHYVIAGESATIQSITMDKEGYAPGESAKINMVYGGSVDNFDYSRFGGTKNEKLTAEIDIRDDKDASCLSEKRTFDLNLASGTSKEFPLSINKECQNPSVMSDIRGRDGQVLDERIFLRSAK